MMKMRILVVVLFVLGLLVTGCALNGDAPQAPPQDPPGVNDGEFSEFPASVAATLETVRQLHAGVAVVDGDQTFIMVSYGEQPTAGYEARITDIQTEGDRAVVTAQLTEPEGPAAEVLTYPYAVEVLDGVYNDVEFHDADEEYFPQVVGLQSPLSLVDRSNNILVGSFGAVDGLVYATGVARVFEATVSYELQDADGNVLLEGFTTAASGGPDWGYYEVMIYDPPAPSDVAKLVIFQESAKDGSKTDVVELPVSFSSG